MPDGAVDALSRQELGHAASRAACHGVFLKGNQVLMLRRQTQNHSLVEGFTQRMSTTVASSASPAASA